MKRGAPESTTSPSSSSTPLERKQMEKEIVELPEELWSAIFSHLPLNGFYSIAQVNKQLLRLIQPLSQQFIQSYFSSTKTDPDFKDNAVRLLAREYKRHQSLFPSIPFHVIFAALNGELDPLQQILSSLNVSSSDKDCLLQYAAKNGHLILVNLLLASCSHSNYWPSASLWPHQKADALLIAAEYGHYNIVNAILFTGSAISHSTRLRLLSFAIRDKHEDTLNFILKNSFGFSQFSFGAKLKEYAQNNQEEYVKILLKKKAVGISAEDEGWVLKYAAEKNYLVIVNICLEKATQITNRDKGLALLIAATQGYLDIVKTLLKDTISNDYKKMAILSAKSKHYDKIATEIEFHLELPPPAVTFAFKQPSSSSLSSSSSEWSEENTDHNEKSSSFSCS